MSIFTSKRVKFLVFPLVVIASLIMMNAFVKDIKDEPVMTQAPWAVDIGMASQGQVTVGFPALGMVQSSSEVRITPQISGAVLALGPRAGGSVKKGDLLVRVDTRELEAGKDSLISKLASAKALFEHDSKELQREQRLFKEGGSAASVVDQWVSKVRGDKANVGSLQKQIDQIKVKIAYGLIRAPIDAGIAQRLAEEGDVAMPGKPIYILTSQQGGRVIVSVPLETLTYLKPGSEVHLKQGSELMLTTITRVNPTLDKLAMGSVEIDLPARPFGLPDGAHVSARVISKIVSNAVIVPEHALLPSSNENQRSLFKVLKKDQKLVLEKLKVRVPLCGQEGCVVEGRIQAGDPVVVAHSSVLLKLNDGDTVITSIGKESEQ